MDIDNIINFNKKWLELQEEYSKWEGEKGRHIPYPEPIQKEIVKTMCDWGVSDYVDSTIDFYLTDYKCEMKSTTKIDGCVNFSADQLNNSEAVIWFYVYAKLKMIFISKIVLNETISKTGESIRGSFIKRYDKSKRIDSFFEEYHDFVESKVFNMETMEEIYIYNANVEPIAPFFQGQSYFEKLRKEGNLLQDSGVRNNVYVIGTHLSNIATKEPKSLRDLLNDSKSELCSFLCKYGFEPSICKNKISFKKSKKQFNNNCLKNSERDLDYLSFYICNVSQATIKSLRGSGNVSCPEILTNIDSDFGTDLESKWAKTSSLYGNHILFKVSDCLAFDGSDPFPSLMNAIMYPIDGNDFLKCQPDKGIYINSFLLK